MSWRWQAGEDRSFDGNYSLNRGLAAALLALVLLSLAFSETDWRVTLGLLPIAMIYTYRMFRFSISYASELYIQFLMLPARSRRSPSAPATTSPGCRFPDLHTGGRARLANAAAVVYVLAPSHSLE